MVHVFSFGALEIQILNFEGMMSAISFEHSERMANEVK